MVIVNPQDLGLWDPLQMAFVLLINGGGPNDPYIHWEPILQAAPATHLEDVSTGGKDVVVGSL